MGFIEKVKTDAGEAMHVRTDPETFRNTLAAAAVDLKEHMKRLGAPDDMAALYETVFLPFSLACASRHFQGGMKTKDQVFCLQLLSNLFMQLVGNDSTSTAPLPDKVAAFLNSFTDLIASNLEGRLQQKAAEAAATRQ
jgi:hypothetical protein